MGQGCNQYRRARLRPRLSGNNYRIDRRDVRFSGASCNLARWVGPHRTPERRQKRGHNKCSPQTGMAFDKHNQKEGCH